MNLSEDEVRGVQAAVDRTIRRIGGYWRPLSALARLLEEIGELAEMLGQREVLASEIGAELADAIIISTCLANQYRKDLGREYSDIRQGLHHREEAPSDGGISQRLFLDVVARSGEVARVINAYEGDKRPKAGEATQTLGRALARFQMAVIDLAENLNISLQEWVARKLEYSIERDSDRFSPSPDPITSECLERFQRIIETTPCPFAEYARLWGLPDWDHLKTIEENALVGLPTLSRFERVALPEAIDGLILEVRGKEYCATLEQVCYTFREILEVWGRSDPSGRDCMKEDLLHPDWQFRFLGVRYFVSVFASCYPRNHPRFSGYEDSMFLFLQPEFSFDFHGIHSANRDLVRIKRQVRDKFAARDRGYSGKLVDQRLEALIYVFPMDKDGSPVYWWRL